MLEVLSETSHSRLSGPRVTREAAETLRKELPALDVYENTYLKAGGG